MLAGELTAAALLLDEADLIAEATGNPPLVNAPMILAAWRGSTSARGRVDRSQLAEEAATRGWTSNGYARAVLYNGLGQHEAARDAVWEAFQPDPIGYGSLLVPELVEAASRTAERALLEYALEWLAERTSVITSGWASGIEARARALLSEGDVADSPVPRVDREPLRHAFTTRARPDAPSVRGVVAPRTAPPRCPNAVADRARGVHQHGRRGVREPRPTRAAGNGRACPQTDGGQTRPTHAAGDPDCAPCRGRTHQSRDSCSALHQPEHGRVPPAQGVPQARREVADGAGTPYGAIVFRLSRGLTSERLLGTARNGHGSVLVVHPDDLPGSLPSGEGLRVSGIRSLSAAATIRR